VLALALERTVLDRAADGRAGARLWGAGHDDAPDDDVRGSSAQLTIVRNAPDDFRDRQVYLWIDGQSRGKIRYGVPLSEEIAPGPHRIRVNNTLFNDTLEFTAAPGEHVRIRCTNGMPPGGWLMLLLLHATYLRVRLERET